MASIRCGRCAGRHDSVEDVRRCYNGETVERTEEALPASQRITEKQVNFLGSMLRRARAHLAGGQQLDALPKRYASELIDAMVAYGKAVKAHDDSAELPMGVVYDPARMSADGDPEGMGDPQPSERFLERTATPDVPAGHYAVKSLTGTNDLDFFRVDRPTEGRWAGRTFVKRIIGGKPDAPVRGVTAKLALEAIAEMGPESAAHLYGQELGRCSRCNRHLTDDISRALSMGPECRSR